MMSDKMSAQGAKGKGRANGARLMGRYAVGMMAGVALLPLLSSAARADTADAAAYSGIIVYGQRDVDEDRSAEGKPLVLTTTTTAETLRDRMVDSITDYARRVDAGVNYNEDTRSVNIRGLDGNRVLTTIDGIRATWLNDGARGVQGGGGTYDFNGLGSIDVVRSSDSSFFGAGALGGVLALRTLDPEDLLNDSNIYGGLSKATYDSASDSLYLNQALAARSGDTLLLVQGGYRSGNETENQGKVDGTGNSRSRKNPADQDQTSLLVKLRQYVPGGHRFGLVGELFSHSYDENTLTSINSTYSSYLTNEKSKRKRVSASYDYRAEEGGTGVQEAHAQIFWRRTNMITDTQAERLTVPVGTYNRNSDLRETAFGGTGSLTAGFATGALTHAVTVGGEVYWTRTHQYAAGEDNCSPAIYSCRFLHVNQSDMPDVRGVDIGLVAQDRIGFGDGDWLHLTPGVRVDWYRRSPRDTAAYQANAAYEGLPDDSRDSHVSPKVLLEAKAAPQLTLYGQYSQAFRAPSATELYLSYGGTGSYVSIGNPDLKPETSRGWEVGVRFGNKERGLRVAFYSNRYRNFIDTITTTAAEAGLSGSFPFGVFKFVNRERVRIRGIEASGDWSFTPQLRGWLSVAYSSGKDLDTDVHLNSIPPLRAIIGLGYAQEHFGADLSATIAAARNKVEDPASDLNKAPSYGLVDFTGWWKPSFVPGLRIQAGVYNLFDKKYWNALDLSGSSTVAKDYYTQPGRTFKVTALFGF